MKVLPIAAIAALSVFAATSTQAQTVSIGTSPQGSSNYALGNALGKVTTEATGLRARVVPFGGGQQVLPMINNGELELAITSATDSLYAHKGKGSFDGKPNPNLRVIGTTLPYYIGWFVKKDSPYKNLTDLKGKKMPIGFKANSAQRRVFLAGLANAGMKPADFDGVPVAHVVRAAEDFKQGKIEGSTFAIGSGKMAEVDAKVGGIRFLNMDNSPDGVKRLKEVIPTAYIAVLEPAKNLAGIVGPTNVIFEDYLVMGGKHLSDEAAYKLAKMLYNDRDKLAAIAKPWGRYKQESLSRDHGIPFHPGAIKFYKEKGIWKDQ